MRLHKSHKSRSKPIDFKDPSDWIAYNEGEHYIGYSKIEKKGKLKPPREIDTIDKHAAVLHNTAESAQMYCCTFTYIEAHQPAIGGCIRLFWFFFFF